MSVIETEREKNEHATIENLVIKVYEMIHEMSKKIEKIEERFGMIENVEYAEKDVKNLNDMVIDLQNDVETSHDEFMQHVDEKFEKMMQTMAFMIKNMKEVKENDNDDKTRNDEESEGSNDENFENEGIEQSTNEETIIEEGDTKIENTKNYHKYLVEYINGEWSIEEYLDEQKESDEIDLS